MSFKVFWTSLLRLYVINLLLEKSRVPAPELMSFFLGIGGRTFRCPIIDSKAATRGPLLSLEEDAITSVNVIQSYSAIAFVKGPYSWPTILVYTNYF